jgi:riboflavin synthase
MFTGLVQDRGRIEEVSRTDAGVRLTVSSELTGELAEGDSIAVGGVCLTATEVRDGSFSAEVMNETLSRSALAGVTEGAAVNLELPLRASDRLGGHIVQGHVDAVGTVSNVTEDGFARRLEIEAPPSLLRYVIEKGSIAVDGVSLTVADASNGSFTVSLIPETLERTTLGTAETGTKVNLEVDVLAKYAERAMRSIAGEGSPEGSQSNQDAGWTPGGGDPAR